MLRIWGRITSINVRKLVWAAQEVGVPFTRIDAGGPFGLTKTPEFTKLNPNSMIPVLEDGEYSLWESNVIVRYLCAKYAGGQLYPTDLEARFNAERWMDWQQTRLNPAAREAFMQWIRTTEEDRQHNLIAQSNAATVPLVAMLDAHLGKNAYVGGNDFGMADIPLACEVHRWQSLPQPRLMRPNVERWIQAILARPATKGVLDLPLS